MQVHFFFVSIRHTICLHIAIPIRTSFHGDKVAIITIIIIITQHANL